MQRAPVNVAARPSAATIPNWRSSAFSSAASSVCAICSGGSPRRSSSSARGPNVVFAHACVAIAPAPLSAHGTTAPTARNFDCTAMPISCCAGSAATMENVESTVSAL